MGGADVFFPPGAFGQSHLALAEAIVGRVQAGVPDGARVAELFAGCGALGLGLLPRAGAVVFNESSEASLEGLALGLAARTAAERARAVVLPGRAEDRLEALDGAEVVILDPPRKGLDPKLVDALRAERPGRVLMLSCGLDSFERDAARLSAPGGLRLQALEVFGLFPYTEHVELLATFER
jgi:tRNA/tmRNA/rRNA uracil-C5-methylase (TrmA/RlmC/RlmD family)